MNILAFIGSARSGGNTARVVEAICKGAEESGHEVNVYNLSEMNIHGCQACDACQLGKVDFCSIHDRLTDLLPQIAEADCLILGTPIYMLQVSGLTKNFLDRLRPFLRPDLTAKDLPGKKFITITCSGAPANAFSNVTEYLNQFFGYYKMENAGNIIAGGLNKPDAILQQPEILENAKHIGKNLI
jgi:Multimeric flavodoxin WrbA